MLSHLNLNLDVVTDFLGQCDDGDVNLEMYSDSELFGVTMELLETKTHLSTLRSIGPDERQILAG